MRELTAFLVAVLLLAFVVAMGCEPAEARTGHPKPTNAELLEGVFELRLSDGTRCVRLYQNSISCDWEAKR
jgi:hypothetical protein